MKNKRNSDYVNHSVKNRLFSRYPAYSIVYVVIFIIFTGCMNGSAAPTTELTVSVLQNNTTIEESIVDYRWMEEHLPVFGDGITHYFHQGPVFQGDPWDPNESVNLRDMGAIKGTRVLDICNLTGGVAEGDEVMIKAVDGYYILFDASTINTPHPQSGPLVITWFNGDESGAGERQGYGYVPDYYMGMRLIFCAPENPETGRHVFGNTDMKEALPERAQYFYSGLYPSTGGLSAKWVDEVRVYRGGYSGDRTTLLTDTKEPEPTKSGLSTITLIISGLSVLFLIRGSYR